MDHQNPINSPPAPAENSNRKFVKDRGNDFETFRKNREEKSIQLRKEKRADRTNIERRKFKIDSKENENTINTYNLRRLDILPKKAALLCDVDPKLQYESAVYFRRVLAADKNPPLDAILQIGTVIPALSSFLTRFELPKLQLEAAWSITNIACGEARHIQALLACNVIPLFSSLIAQTTFSNIKEQSLWALSNMSSEETACQLICHQTSPHLLPLILHEIGVLCHCPDPAHQPEVFEPRHLSENDNPSLSIMRHVTFICGNVIKQKPLISPYLYRCIFFAFADLLQSPDEEIKLDICQTIVIAASQQPDVVSMLAEEGIVGRLRELAIQETASLSATRELAIVALSAVFKSAPEIVRKGIVTQFQASVSPSPFLSLVLTLLTSTTNNASRRDAIQAIVAYVELGVVYKAAAVTQQLWQVLRELSIQGSYNVRTEIGILICKLFPDALNYLTTDVAQMLVEVCRDLISVSDGDVLLRLLQSIATLLKFSASHYHPLPHLPVLHEKVEFLILHPTSSIAGEAQTLEKLILAAMRQQDTDFDEYEI